MMFAGGNDRSSPRSNLRVTACSARVGGAVAAFITMLQLIVFCTLANCSVSNAQEIERVEPPLIDQEPFDLIVLTPEEGGDRVKVLPLDFRQKPSNPKPTDTLDVVLVKFQERRYEVKWKSIQDILFYEQRVYDEALQKMKEKDFPTAFQNLSFLRKNYPSMPRLEQLRQEFILQSAIDQYRKGDLRQTLSALEELKASAPGFRSQAVTNQLSRVADSLITEYQQGGQLGFAKKLLERLRDQYGPTLPVVAAWDRKLEQLALGRKDEAARLFAEGKYVEARRVAVDMLSIFPDLDEAKSLIKEINDTYPMVRVGVMQRSAALDPASLVDWPARRSGMLVYQSLFRFLETGSEGGRYGFSLGSFRMSDDRQELILSLDPAVQQSLTAFELAHQLLHRADPENEIYDPSWAAIFESVYAPTGRQVIVKLKRPNVLPHALMQWRLPNQNDEPGALPGDYYLASQADGETSYKLRPEKKTQAGTRPVEIVEVFYEDPKRAVNDLLRGEIDLIDQLYPADARRLERYREVQVGSYELPACHMLIPISDHEFLANTKFRRALLYGTNREGILQGELLDSSSTTDGRLVSGPFPLGTDESDPLAYAYNREVEPTMFSPQLARLLLVMASKELAAKAEKKKEPAPELRKLVVGCPDYEFARVAVQAMIQQWQNVGIQAEMVVLPNAELNLNSGCDMLYMVTTMWEPATDIERLLGGNGIARTDNSFIVQALERLRDCRNWREIRRALNDLHTLIDYHLPILPLWQVTDRFAVSSKIEGLEGRPVALYQDIDQWRVNLGSP